MNKVVERKKLNKPVFRGRFGTRTKRKNTIAKWDKWRVARGIDIKWEKGDGHRPRVGYKTKKELRNIHPKGLPELLIRSKSDIVNFDVKKAKSFVFKFAATIGNKKKTELLKLAKEKGMQILNDKVYVKKKTVKKVKKTEVKVEKHVDEKSEKKETSKEKTEEKKEEKKN